MFLKDFIICDDIRQEIWNKQTLIGVYDDTLDFYVDDIKNDKWPKIMKTATYLRIQKEEKDVFPDKFKVTFFYESKPFLAAEGNIPENPRNIQLITIFIINNNFIYPGPGQYTFKLELFLKDSLIIDINPNYCLKVNSHSMPIPIITGI